MRLTYRLVRLTHQRQSPYTNVYCESWFVIYARCVCQWDDCLGLNSHLSCLLSSQFLRNASTCSCLVIPTRQLNFDSYDFAIRLDSLCLRSFSSEKENTFFERPAIFTTNGTNFVFFLFQFWSRIWLGWHRCVRNPFTKQIYHKSNCVRALNHAKRGRKVSHIGPMYERLRYRYDDNNSQICRSEALLLRASGLPFSDSVKICQFSRSFFEQKRLPRQVKSQFFCSSFLKSEKL